MESETFRSRLAKLVQKSRKALRLYTTMGRIQTAENSELTELQTQEWREVNSELFNQLVLALKNSNSKALARDVYAIRDHFYNDWRAAESDLRVKQEELSMVVENEDFIKAAMLSRELAILKARLQASQAAHHEVQEVLKRSRVAPAIESVSQEETPEPEQLPEHRTAKVIPLKRV